MIRALLDGRKMQTRRTMKPQPDDFGIGEVYKGSDHLSEWLGMCPYGKPGDLLIVREAHSIFNAHGQHRTDGKRWGPWGGLPTKTSPDGTQIAYYREGFDRCDPGRWRPSIHMPRWASRLTLRITDVRVQRLKEISEEDARAEGVTLESNDPPDTARAAFYRLWESINGSGSWDENPWVWCVSFDVIRQNVDDVLRACGAGGFGAGY